MKYEFMAEHEEMFRVKSMCRVLKVSRSGYYAWRSRMPSKRQKSNEKLLERICEVHAKNRRLYGSPRITAELREKGIGCGKNRVARLMKDNGIRALVKRQWSRKKTTTNRNYVLAANLLVERGQTERVWAADMTYVRTAEGWLYVSAVMNVQSRKIIGLSMGDRISEDLASSALKDAVQRQRPSEGLIHHSDRGRQYASYAYQELLKKHGITASMNRSGNCYDNAYMESFFGTLKSELIYGQKYIGRMEARLSIFEYVMMFYNRRRRHSALGYKSPEQFEAQNKQT